jgi:hypothetical protein
MTEEEMSGLTREEAVKVFFELAIKAAETKGAHEAVRLRLLQMQGDPNLTDDQRELIRKALAHCSD